MVETKLGTAITVKMVVKDGKPVFNAEANEKMSANDFYLDTADVDELDAATIIARADARPGTPTPMSSYPSRMWSTRSRRKTVPIRLPSPPQPAPRSLST